MGLWWFSLQEVDDVRWIGEVFGDIVQGLRGGGFEREEKEGEV